jgi:hypothetical protein
MITLNQTHPSDLLYREEVLSVEMALTLRIEALKQEQVEGEESEHLEIAEEVLTQLYEIKDKERSEHEYLLGLLHGQNKKIVFLAGCLLDKDWKALAI